ncbi:MAG: hypothetical protein CME70_19335 [Halobacteriovorax sp.]|nr:hypothetical protein [Halobacteriovorax sp.]MBK26160.1 hypothetical protein [Halobacteriovorax sp.]|tara:strand:- start:148 stop:399 length:252 start_codon:yes stop_codon:yes gene_type:complete
MTYKVPDNDIQKNEEWLRHCVREEVRVELDIAFSDFLELLLRQSSEDINLRNPTRPSNFWVGLGIGACLFVGFVAGILIKGII